MLKKSRLRRLRRLRNEIAHIDLQIIKFLAKRFKISSKIQKLKKFAEMPIYQKERELNLIKRYLNTAHKKKLPQVLIKKLFQMVFYYSKKTGIINRS